MNIAFRWEKRKQKDNTKMDLRKIWWGDIEWSNMDQDRALVSTVMNLLIP
jgi:hypothetical protein